MRTGPSGLYKKITEIAETFDIQYEEITVIADTDDAALSDADTDYDGYTS